jgi:hypothetical protein
MFRLPPVRLVPRQHTQIAELELQRRRLGRTRGRHAFHAFAELEVDIRER